MQEARFGGPFLCEVLLEPGTQWQVAAAPGLPSICLLMQAT